MSTMSNATTRDGGGSNGVWGSFVAGLSDGAKTIGQTTLPNWVNTQLNLQSSDQLVRDTYTGDPAANLNNIKSSGTVETVTPPKTFIEENKTVIYIGLGFIGLFAVYMIASN